MIYWCFTERITRFVFSRASITLAARHQTHVGNGTLPPNSRPGAVFLFGVEARLEIWRIGILSWVSVKHGEKKAPLFLPRMTGGIICMSSAKAAPEKRRCCAI